MGWRQNTRKSKSTPRPVLAAVYLLTDGKARCADGVSNLDDPASATSGIPDELAGTVH
jgi:hypothetical protein